MNRLLRTFSQQYYEGSVKRQRMETASRFRLSSSRLSLLHSGQATVDLGSSYHWGEQVQRSANVYNLVRERPGTFLIAGKTGSGKSTLLHAIITNLALIYGPDEVELYLVDFKKGVEFKTYATHALPHARVVAIESERGFGLSVLQRLDRELKARGDAFREQGVQDIASFREAKRGVRCHAFC